MHNAYRVLSGVLEAAVRANYTRANVARALTRNDLPKPSGRAESVSRLGPGEVHIDPPKNGKVRTVPVTADLAAALREYASVHPDFSPRSYVWPSPVDSPTKPMHKGRDFYLREWKAAVARAGLPKGLRFHDLRHTGASLLIAANIRAKAIQAHLGHSSFAITMDRYAHLYSTAADEVANALGTAFA